MNKKKLSSNNLQTHSLGFKAEKLSKRVQTYRRSIGGSKESYPATKKGTLSAIKMQERSFFNQRKAAVALVIVLLMLIQQACAGPLLSKVQSSSDPEYAGLKRQPGVHTLRRVARMTPLWRLMNSKPFGAYCQNNYECSTGLCRAGQCSTSHPPEAAKY